MTLFVRVMLFGGTYKTDARFSCLITTPVLTGDVLGRSQGHSRQQPRGREVVHLVCQRSHLRPCTDMQWYSQGKAQLYAQLRAREMSWWSLFAVYCVKYGLRPLRSWNVMNVMRQDLTEG